MTGRSGHGGRWLVALPLAATLALVGGSPSPLRSAGIRVVAASTVSTTDTDAAMARP